jgi:hypothetical protein
MSGFLFQRFLLLITYYSNIRDWVTSQVGTAGTLHVSLASCTIDVRYLFLSELVMMYTQALHHVYYEPLAHVAPSLEKLLQGEPVRKLLFMTSPKASILSLGLTISLLVLMFTRKPLRSCAGAWAQSYQLYTVISDNSIALPPLGWNVLMWVVCACQCYWGAPTG